MATNYRVFGIASSESHRRISAENVSLIRNLSKMWTKLQRLAHKPQSKMKVSSIATLQTILFLTFWYC